MILLINTCGEQATVALADGARILAEEQLPGREASEKLIPVLRRVLAQAGPLQAVGVVYGPGSFTGARVGLSAAKGLCEACAAGMIAMSRLQLVALETKREEALAVLDAGRGEFYCGFYRGGVVEREGILKRDALLAVAQGCDVLTCEPKVRAVLSQYIDLTLVREPQSLEMLSLVRARILRGEWSDVATVDANYLRRTDAELLQEAK